MPMFGIVNMTNYFLSQIQIIEGRRAIINDATIPVEKGTKQKKNIVTTYYKLSVTNKEVSDRKMYKITSASNVIRDRCYFMNFSLRHL